MNNETPCGVKSADKLDCPCTYNCAYHGKCCLCIARHAPKGQFPACCFSKEGEATYDRSYAQLRKDRDRA